METIAIPGKL